MVFLQNLILRKPSLTFPTLMRLCLLKYWESFKESVGQKNSETSYFALRIKCFVVAHIKKILKSKK